MTQALRAIAGGLGRGLTLRREISRCCGAMAKELSALAQDTRGLTATEYALIAFLVVITIVAAIFFFGGALSNAFNSLGAQVNAV